MDPKLKREDEIDSRYDNEFNRRSLQTQEEETGKSAYVNAGADQAEAFANDPANASDANINDAREREANNQFGYNKSLSNKRDQKGKGFFKKKGPIAGIAGIVALGGLGLGLLSPALLIVHLKETLTDKFNDQLTAMDMRTTKILKKKLSKTTITGICTSKVSVRCKYRTVSSRQLKKLEKAGITVPESEKGNRALVGNRTKPSVFEFKGERIAASDLISKAASDPDLRSALRRAYNPKFAAFSDKIAAKVRAKLGIKKSKNITPGSEEKMKEELKDNASGKSNLQEGAHLKETKDEHGNVQYEDPDTGKVYKGEEASRIKSAQAEASRLEGLSSSARKAGLKAGVKGALTVTALGLGAVDSACTVWNLIRVADFAAKLYGARQLIRYAYEFMNEADAIKAGDAKPEDTAFMGNILTKPNAAGQTATDSNGFRYAAYGDLFHAGSFDTSHSGGTKGELTQSAVDKNEIENETAKYVSGQIIPDNLFTKIIGLFRGFGSTTTGIDKFCKFDKSWTGQAIIIGASLVGAVVGIFTGGSSLSVGAAAQAAVSVALSVTFAVLQPKLMDLAKGELITGDENGNEAGNAITSGAGAYNSQSSQGRGIPVLKKGDAAAYDNLSQQIASTYNADETASLSPFDPTSNHTFVGSIVNTLLPYRTTFASAGSGLLSLGSLVSNSFDSLLSAPANATGFTKDEFNSCSDPEYTSRDLAADPFCNLRHGLSTQALNRDPEEVLDAMGDNINDDGSPKSGSAYEKYINNCINRDASIGDPSADDTGDDCIQGGKGWSKQDETFSLFYMDQSIEDGMDNGFDSGDGSSSSQTTDSSASTPITGNAKELAQQVINNTNITKAPNALKDLKATVNGQNLTGCSPAVPLSPALLKAMLGIAQKYKYQINDIETGHDCDGLQHTKGKAMDIFFLDGESMTKVWGSNPQKAISFSQGIAKILHAQDPTKPFGLGVDSSKVLQVAGVKSGRSDYQVMLGNIQVFADSSPGDEVHVDVRGSQ